MLITVNTIRVRIILVCLLCMPNMFLAMLLLKCFHAMIFRFNNLNIPLQIIIELGHSLF